MQLRLAATDKCAAVTPPNDLSTNPVGRLSCLLESEINLMYVGEAEAPRETTPQI